MLQSRLNGKCRIKYTGPIFLVLFAFSLAGCARSTSQAKLPDDLRAAIQLGKETGDPQNLGRSFTADFYRGQNITLWHHFSSKFRAAMKSEKAWGKTAKGILGQIGHEVELLREDVLNTKLNRGYRRVARFSKIKKPLQLVWLFDADYKIAGFVVSEESKEADSDKLDYQTKTPLQLPIEGETYVFWGGRSVVQNYHAETSDQRFAYDFLVVKDGRSHSGDGSTNEDYYCHGVPVVAVGPGKIVTATDGIAENNPGEMNTNKDEFAGNLVVIDHGNGEFSFFAHLAPGSVQVKSGDQVNAGDQIGRCGNSGFSTEPHLHYHMQDSPRLLDGVGLPTQFLNYVADGQIVGRGEPVQGQIVEQR